MGRSTSAALRGFGIALVCGLAAAAASADEGADASAMRVAIDKETGKLRAATVAEAAELARLERAARRSADTGQSPPETEEEALATLRVFDSGYIGMDVPLSLNNSLQATVQPDGSLRIEHVQHDHAASQDQDHDAHGHAGEVRREDR